MDISGGGVTFSGGEPLMYPKELKSLLIMCGEKGIHRAIDTAGHVKSSIFEEILPLTDLFLYDLKIMDSEKHKKWTGASNKQVLENLRLISDSGKKFHIRIPLIEGVNCDDENIQNSITFLNRLKPRPAAIEFLPYHNIAIKKYEKLGRVYNEMEMSKPADEKVAGIMSQFRENGFNVLIS